MSALVSTVRVKSTARNVLMLTIAMACACSRKSQRSGGTENQSDVNQTAAARESANSRGPKPKTEPHNLAQATPQNPLRPAPPEGRTARNPPASPPKGRPALDKLKLPEGFRIDLYSDRVPNARSLALGKKGTVFVSTRKDDRVYALVDDNSDYKPDHVYTVADNLDTPNGIAYKDGSLYIAQVDKLLRIDDIDSRLQDPPDPKLVTDQLPSHPHHGWRYIRFGPDGWLYIPIGAPCNVCQRKEPIFASISRMKPDGTGLEIFASGVRNSVGFDWHPKTKELWFTENGRDELGNDLPPDELNRAPKPGLHFGFPYCHGGKIIDPEFGKQRTCSEFEPPALNLGPHVAALGMRFYTGSMFPKGYENAIILAEHGSWNRDSKIGYRVMVVRLEGRRAKSYEPLVRFLDEKTGDVHGRPVDVAVLDDGSLLVSDDWQGAVYRVSYEANLEAPSK